MRHLAIALLVLAIGCGDDIQRIGDDDASMGTDDGGSGSDAGIEIDADPNVRGTVTVHVVDKTGAPVPGLHAVFIDTDSTVTDVVTDANGAAQASVYPSATVTVVRERSTMGAYSMTTVQELVPGDDIKIYSAPSTAPATDDAMSSRVVPLDQTSAGNFTFNYSTRAGANSYSVFTPCGRTDVGGSTSPSLPFKAGCASGTFDVLVVAASGSNALAWTSKSAVAFSSGGSTTITEPWHDVESFDMSYTNVTNRVTGIDMQRFMPYVRGIAQVTGAGTTAGSDVTVSTTKAAKGLPAIIKSKFTCSEGSGPDCISSATGTAAQSITTVIDGNAASSSLDVGANLLPWVSASYDPLTTTIQVTTTGSGAIDLFEANLRYTRNDSVIYTWRVFGPTPGNVTFPTLPSTLPGDPTVRPTDAQSVYQVFLCESTALNGYRDAIHDVYEALGTCDASSTATGTNATKPLAPTTGTSRLSQWN